MKFCKQCGTNKKNGDYYKGKNICKICFSERERLRYHEKMKKPEALAARNKQKKSWTKAPETDYIKKCKTCGLEAHNTNELRVFKYDKTCSHNRLNHCTECWNKHNSTTRPSRVGVKTEEQKIQAKASQLKLKYGITIEAWNTMYLKQGGTCKICSKSISTKEVHTDHDHSTGKVRGLLCSNCNTGIGLLQDSPRVLKEALRYLEEEGHYGED